MPVLIFNKCEKRLHVISLIFIQVQENPLKYSKSELSHFKAALT